MMKAPIHLSRGLLALAAAALLVTTAAASAADRFDFDATPSLLGKAARPLRYRLQLDLDPAKPRFTGQAGIDVELREPQATIALHAFELDVAEAWLVSGSRRTRLNVAADEATQTWRLKPDDATPIAAGPHTIELRWSGKVRDTGEGLFAAPYGAKSSSGRMLATQLEAISARAVFPSFDEPLFRAPIELTVRAPKAERVVSNMPVAEEHDDPADASVRIHRFAPTPPMQSYLMSVAVGRMDELTGEAAGVPLRILTAPGKREQARYALKATQQILPYYNAYFGQAYALPKLDQLAVPSVRNGAMEDWGLISYAESVLLYDPKRSSPDTQRWVYSVIAHEVAHQWFGDLVAPASWEEIWLNEAFATWMQDKATDHFNPDWQVRVRGRQPMEEAMRVDATKATRAIRSGPVNERRVFEVFDDITYQKGGAVLSMLEQWIGEDAFKKGLAAYMAERKFSNATAGDLWHHIGQAAGRDVTAVASSWTDQPGFPVVSVRSACERGSTRVHLQQRRFGAAPDQADGARWRIPVRLARGSEATTVMLDAAEQTVDLPGCRRTPLVANAGGAGFYRVHYTPVALKELTAGIDRLAPSDRVSLMADTFALAQAGELPMSAFFDLAARIPSVHDASRAALFSTAADSFRELDQALSGTSAQGPLHAAGRLLFGRELARLGWLARSGEPSESTALRSELIGLLARFGDRAVAARAGRLFDAHAAGRRAVPGSIRQGVVMAVGYTADARRFDGLFKQMQAAKDEEDKRLFSNALAAGGDRARAERLMTLAIAGAMPSNIARRVPSRVAEYSPLGAQAYHFARQHWSQLADLSDRQFGGHFWILPGAAITSNDEAMGKRLLADQAELAGADGATLASQVAEMVQRRAALKQRESARLAVSLAAWRPVR
jgi:aminopeptidase N